MKRFVIIEKHKHKHVSEATPYTQQSSSHNATMLSNKKLGKRTDLTPSPIKHLLMD